MRRFFVLFLLFVGVLGMATAVTRAAPASSTTSLFTELPAAPQSTALQPVPGVPKPGAPFVPFLDEFQPGADSCSNATALSFSSGEPRSVTFVTDMTQAAEDPVLSCMWGAPTSNKGYRTVWYKFVAPYNGRVTINTQTSNYDTVVAIHTGSCGSLATLACNDDHDGFASETTITVKAGTTYYVEVADWDVGASGAKQLNLSFESDEVDSLWRILSGTQIGRTRHATVAVDGKIYLVGGYDDFDNARTNDLFRYDPATNAWTGAGQLNPIPSSSGLDYVTAAYTSVNGRIYVPGGDNGAQSTYSTQHHYYILSIASWLPAASLPVGTGWAQAVSVPGQADYYLIGGLTGKDPEPVFGSPPVAATSAVWKYSATQDKWDAATSLNSPRYGHTAAYVGGRICVVGGLNEQNQLLPGGECWTPGGGSWQPIDALNIARFGAGSAVAPDGRWYVFGGHDGNFNAVPEVEVYDPNDASPQWEVLDVPYDLGGKPALPARAWVTGEFIGDTLYAVGGNSVNLELTDCTITGIPICGNVLPIMQRLKPAGRLITNLPLVLKSGSDGFDNNLAQARPLLFNVPQSGSFTQSTDFYNAYRFDVTGFTAVTVRLTGIPSASDYDIFLYDDGKSLRAQGTKSANQNETISLALLPGRYYLMVQRMYGSASSSHYQIVVNN